MEHTDNDNYSGDGGDGSGLNRLGVLLVELRETYLNEGQADQNNFFSNTII